MKNQKYTLLAEVTLLHNYFEDGFFRDIRIVPDKVTQTFMWNAGLLFRLTDTGFSIFYSDPFNVDYLKEITSFFNNQLLRFQLFGESSDFMNYTDCPLGRLVVYKYNNRDTRESEATYLMLPKLNQRLYSQSPLGEVDLYLSEFLNEEGISPKDYIIMFSARNTRWKYYVMNVAEAEADRLIIEDSTGHPFDGPVKREMPGSKSAFEFSSGNMLFPFQEKPKSFCSLKKKSLVTSDERDDAAPNEMLVQSLPVPSPQAITTIETDENEQVACSSMYIYL
ncbi:hypothetical protein [Ekhidna sp.]|uniref:hypothetical protein n=1 Tax=Ekhidna sp. TaxID=2608089 RepID=UPI003299BE7E